MRFKIYLIISVAVIYSCSLTAQQVADTTFNPIIQKPEYSKGKGPVVTIDQGHYNFHTANGRYLPFTRLLRSDGYNIDSCMGDFSTQMLKKTRILIIANALNKINIQNWFVPTPSAFTTEEIKNVKNWVENGGSLFLIADHMPFGGAAKDLSSAFGFSFTNGFAADTSNPGDAFFYRKDGSLNSCSISNGRTPGETVNKVVTFTGQAFGIPAGATSILKFDKHYLLLETDTAWVFDSHTRYLPVNGWSQGAFMKFGKGRVVMFGEAAMFSAQLAGKDKRKVGMNSDYAEENYKLLLNIIHWLDKKFD
jgi:hypothetical protein